MGVLGVEDFDLIVKHIADFLYQYLDYKNLEIEARFGQILDKQTNQRIYMPVVNHVILSDDMEQRIRFQADIDVNVHKHFNQLFNASVMKSQKQQDVSVKVNYKHTRVLDEIYEGQTREGNVRVSKDAQSGNVIAVVQKKKLENIHIHFPQSQFDVRLSVATEDAVPAPVGQKLKFTRHKDRLSYQYDNVQVDLTQVKSSDGQVSHELELEVCNVQLIKTQKDLHSQNKPNNFNQIISKLVDYIAEICYSIPN